MGEPLRGMFTMMVYPDVGQYKMIQLKSLERAHTKLGKEFNPHEYANLSRKNLQHVIHELAQELVICEKKSKRSGGSRRN